MKKFIYFFAFSALLISGCVSSDEIPKVETPVMESPTIEPVQENPYSDWTTFENEEMGISFQHPSSIYPQVSRQSALDQGVKWSVDVGDVSLVMTSGDFAEGISEGCCFYYEGEALDLNVAEDILSNKFSSARDLHRMKVGGKDAVNFVRENTYVGSWEVPTIIVPNPVEGYANLMISGPSLNEDQNVFEGVTETLEFIK